MNQNKATNGNIQCTIYHVRKDGENVHNPRER